MRPHGNKSRLFAMATLVLAGAWHNCYAQVGPHCSNGHCGSPLAGPCAPARMTYGWVPTQWRRWPTVQASANVRAPEELPTPAKSDTLPEPGTPTPGRSTPSEPSRPSGDTLTPPFGPSTLSPPIIDEPPAAPFGGEPVAPPSAADPLADPFGDEPPSPPGEESPSSQEPVPDQFPPLNEPAPPASQTDPLFESDQAPAMPADDPFKDDPEPGAAPDTGTSSWLDQNYRAARERMAAARAGGQRDAVSDDAGKELDPSEPRLLRADGETLEPARLTTQAQEDPNPLRQVSHPVQKTTYKEAEETPGQPRTRELSLWRRNPLRAE